MMFFLYKETEKIRPVGSGAAWRLSPHQKFAGRGKKRKRREERNKKEEKEREKRGKKGRGEKDVLGLWV